MHQSLGTIARCFAGIFAVAGVTWFALSSASALADANADVGNRDLVGSPTRTNADTDAAIPAVTIAESLPDGWQGRLETLGPATAILIANTSPGSILLIHARGCEPVPVDERFPRTLRDWQEALAQRDESRFLAMSRRVMQQLWNPVATALAEDITHVVLCGNAFDSIALDALPLADGSFLLERLAVTHAASLASVARILAPAAPADESPSADAAPLDLLAVGGIHYGSSRGTPPPSFAPIAGSGAEALAVIGLHQQTYGAGRDRTFLTGKDADESRLRRELAKHRTIHLATHGFYLASAPGSEPAAPESNDTRPDERARTADRYPGLLAGVACAGANERTATDDEPDGLLTAEELAWLDLSKVDLIVLSGSETGLGRPTAGEGLQGSRRALRIAGAKTVISTLWTLRDADVRRIMHDFFHRLWVRGEDKATAFRATKLAALERQRSRLSEGDGGSVPGSWGAFVLEGAWK